jgi:hypothetical protein
MTAPCTARYYEETWVSGTWKRGAFRTFEKRGQTYFLGRIYWLQYGSRLLSVRIFAICIDIG